MDLAAPTLYGVNARRLILGQAEWGAAAAVPWEGLQVSSTRSTTPGRLLERLRGLPHRRPWRRWVRRRPGLNQCVRAAVFVLGLLVILGGAALWLFSMLLTVPLLFLGLWIWSWEFVWAQDLLHRFRKWLHRFIEKVKQRPRRWSFVTALGVASGAAGYWACFHFGLL